MDSTRRSMAPGAAPGVPGSTRRPGIPRASVAAPGPAGGPFGGSTMGTAAGRYSMAPQRNVRASMAPSAAQQAGPSSQPYGAAPATVSRTGHTYGGQAAIPSGQRGDAGYLRQSHAPVEYVRPSERRSSMGRRQSSSNNQGTLQSFIGLYAPRAGLKDPRNLRNDASARARCANEVADFLIQHRYPAEAKITMQTITQKDFENTFKFLYSRFDPSHGPWTGKFDDEVIKKCMPACGYPFASEVNRSALATVGAKHSWFAVLGIMHWLVVAIKVREAAFDLYPEVVIDIEAPDSQEGMERPQAKVEFWAEYLSRSYPLFLASEDYEQSLEPHIAKLRERFEAHQERTRLHIDERKLEASALERDLERMQSMPNELEIKQQEHAKLQKDLESLDNFMQTLEKRSQQVKKQLDEFTKRIRELEDTKRQRQAEVQQLQSQVNQQNLSDAEVQRLTTDRMNLDEQARTLADRENILLREGADLEVDLRRLMNRIEKHCEEYTSRMSRHGLIPKPTAGEYADVDFVQEINGSANIAADIAPDPAKSAAVRPALHRMKQQANSERNKHIDAALIVEAELTKLNERIAELKEALAESEGSHQQLKEGMDADRDTLARELHDANADLERREREHVEIRNNLNSGVLGADQKLQALDHEYTRLQAAVERSRKENTDALAESLDVIISFKDFVKGKVEDMYKVAAE